MDPAEDWITFEQPLNERTRSFLRLSFLLAEVEHHRQDRTDWGARATIRALLDTLSVLARSDFKTELIKDLGEQQASLSRLRGHAEVDTKRLEAVLAEAARAVTALVQGAPTYAGALLRENDFLYAIHSRTAIPGGTCEFDLPSYHRWLQRGPDAIEHDLSTWTGRLKPFRTAVELSLRLLRESSQPEDQVASGGVFLHVPQALYSLVRVLVPASADIYPEISASKHRVAIRFMSLGNVNLRNVQAGGNQRFRLQCCSAGSSSGG